MPDRHPTSLRRGESDAPREGPTVRIRFPPPASQRQVTTRARYVEDCVACPSVSGVAKPDSLGGNSMTTTGITTGPLSEVEHGRQLRRALIASTVGTTIEWYDFLLYGRVPP